MERAKTKKAAEEADYQKKKQDFDAAQAKAARDKAESEEKVGQMQKRKALYAKSKNKKAAEQGAAKRQARAKLEAEWAKMDEDEAQALSKSSNAKKKEYLLKKQKEKEQRDKALGAVGGDPSDQLSTDELLALLDESDEEGGEVDYKAIQKAAEEEEKRKGKGKGKGAGKKRPPPPPKKRTFFGRKSEKPSEPDDDGDANGDVPDGYVTPNNEINLDDEGGDENNMGQVKKVRVSARHHHVNGNTDVCLKGQAQT